MNLYTRRRLANSFHLTMAILATSFGLFWLVWLLWTLLVNGFVWLSWNVFAMNTPGPGSQGGLMNAIVGSVLITGCGTLVGTPIGILAGTYLSEYGRGSRIAALVRFVSDILLSAPSILIGVFIYEVLVLRMGHASAMAGSFALAIIIIPVVVRTTEDIMRLVPVSLREAAAALGAPQWKVVTLVVYRAARAGILTGVLLGVARISGETAPLLFTNMGNQFFSTDMNEEMANLPTVIFKFAMSPYEDWQHLAWAGALLITGTVLIINVLTRVFFRTRHTDY